MKKYMIVVSLVIISFIGLQEANAGALAKGIARVAAVAGRKLVAGFAEEVGKELARQAIDSFSKKKEQESADTQYRLGWEFDEQKSYAEAARWYLKAAQKGHVGAQYNLGDMYYYGDGVQQSYAEAFYWFEKAAYQGDADALYNLGIMYDNGYGVRKSFSEAARWYLKAAKKGHVGAQYNLGDMYFYGEGVQQSNSDSFYWTEKAAYQGFAKGQTALGLMYFYGEGVTRSYSKAFYWNEKAADQGLAQAQYNLGHMYDYGYGVKHSVSDAVYWYRKAARQGHKLAEDNLRELITALVQKSLHRLGYYSGPIDGKLGSKTRNAIRQYQSYHQLYVDGRISKSLLTRLGLRF
jgi:TPR repeat protein